MSKLLLVKLSLKKKLLLQRERESNWKRLKKNIKRMSLRRKEKKLPSSRKNKRRLKTKH